MEFDSDGFLLNWRDWTQESAELIAQEQHVSLTEAHWEIIRLAQEFYHEFEHAPSQRPLARYIKLTLGADKAASIYLMQLFGQSPAKMIARIGGLPKPKNCL